MFTPLVVALALIGLPPNDVAASTAFCSVRGPDGTRYAPSLASTVALPQRADVIVRATVGPLESPLSPEAAAQPQRGMYERLEFRVLEVLKGTDVPERLHIRGFLVEHDDFNAQPVPYIWAREGRFGGSCFAYEYQRGGEFLLFLRNQSGGLTPYWAIFSPTNEQVRGADDPWVAWVRDRLVNPER